jgi:hypothetical protein
MYEEYEETVVTSTGRIGKYRPLLDGKGMVRDDGVVYAVPDSIEVTVKLLDDVPVKSYYFTDEWAKYGLIREGCITVPPLTIESAKWLRPVGQAQDIDDNIELYYALDKIQLPRFLSWSASVGHAFDDETLLSGIYGGPKYADRWYTTSVLLAPNGDIKEVSVYFWRDLWQSA